MEELESLSGPIRIVDYDPEWPHRFEQEASRIQSATSVPGLPAKPVIDIVLVVASSATESDYARALEGAGYHLRVREPDWHEHRR